MAQSYNKRAIIMSEPWLNELGEQPIGNCTIDGLVKALHNGWRVSRMYFRATERINPIYLNARDVPFPTYWYFWQPGMDVPQRRNVEDVPHGNSGWNTVYLIKEKSEFTTKDELE